MGFDVDFLPGHRINLPTLPRRLALRTFNAGRPVHHTRFSLLFSQERGLAIYTAHNIGGATLIPEGEIKRVNRFRLDPQIPSWIQTSNRRGYRSNIYDRSHMVSRRSLHWGDEDVAKTADQESFFYSAIGPMHHTLHSDIWHSIEAWILGAADENSKRASVFTGPVLSHDDEWIENADGEILQVPRAWWKISAIAHDGELRCASFLCHQRGLKEYDELEFHPHLDQVRVATIEALTSLSFGELRDARPLIVDSSQLLRWER